MSDAIIAPPGGFPITTSDPCWDEKGGGKIKRGADKHYQVLKLPDILRVMLRAECFQPAPNSVHVMWTTMSSLPKAMWLMDAIGFRYVTHGVWVKTKIDLAGTGFNAGIGQYFRGAHELFLVGTRGSGFKVKTDDKSIPSVIMAPPPREEAADGKVKRKHSRKPLAFIEMIERRFNGQALEMFARKGDRPRWQYWGDEYMPRDEDSDDAAEDDAAEVPEDPAES